MMDLLQTHAIAPALVLRGGGAWLEALPRIVALGQRPFLLGRSASTFGLRQQLLVDLERAGARPVASRAFRDCCDEDLVPLAQEVRVAGCDALIAAGGGKVLDDTQRQVVSDESGLLVVTGLWIGATYDFRYRDPAARPRRVTIAADDVSQGVYAIPNFYG